MTREQFEDILTGPQDLTPENLKMLLEYSRKEKTSVEYKQEFDREKEGKVKLIDFCKVLIAFLNSDSKGSVLIYGIDNAIVKSTSEDVSAYMLGHELSGTRIEDLVGYIKERIWPSEVWMIHIKQLPISETKAITTIYVGRGRSKPYFYYQPNNPANGIRSFQRGSAGTYELEAPQLHQFITQTSKPSQPDASEEGQATILLSPKKNIILKDNLADVLKILKNPEQFGVFTFYIAPSNHIKIADEEIAALIDPKGSYKIRYTELFYYTDPPKISQKWYRRIFIPNSLRPENKCTWSMTCYRSTGEICVSGLVDSYLKGQKIPPSVLVLVRTSTNPSICKVIIRSKSRFIKTHYRFQIHRDIWISLILLRNHRKNPSLLGVLRTD